ncbi:MULTISPECIES: group I intron-associated PD-(D/E)XK endonuclease [Bacteria]|jgi:hypothetical protein|uniref:group I intron-associated PD-(D/E)XK endonuclease n=1 Tax=Bacteria TaxID=2 RepID=UPI001C3ED1D7|nr:MULTISPECIES: group I intron-associated PD-(D/E)XK endonuclease [Bacteria]
MNSKRIGNIGEAKVLAKFVEMGIPIYIPFGDDEKADLIAEFDGKLNKIQVKTSIKSKNGCSIFDLTSSTAHRTNGERRKYLNSEIDYFALYSLDRDKIYLMKVPDNPMSAITIRFEDTKSGMKSRVNYESDFLIENVLKI